VAIIEDNFKFLLPDLLPPGGSLDGQLVGWNFDPILVNTEVAR
jgi:hypothetical protein